MEKKIKCLENYEAWSRPTKIDFESKVGRDIWEEHWENCERLHKMMVRSQRLSDKIKQSITNEMDTTRMVNVPKLEQRKVITVKSNKKIGVLVQTTLKEILESNTISPTVIDLLQTEKYSKETFNINFPVLKEVDRSRNMDEQKKDSRGYIRYYKSTVKIQGKTYFLSSQWYDFSRTHLERWIAKNS
ncbi:hypothetical protein [Halalkalibacter akibai]|nr:hypothetical protein [Halalkalibacter akibai]